MGSEDLARGKIKTVKLFSGLILATIVVASFSGPSSAQEHETLTQQDAVHGYESVTNGRAGIPEDWATHRLVFSRPIAGTVAYEKVMHEPRYWMQQIKRSSAAKPLVDGESTAIRRKRKSTVNKDWQSNLASGAGAVQPNVYPAKYSFDSTTASCAAPMSITIADSLPLESGYTPRTV